MSSVFLHELRTRSSLRQSDLRSELYLPTLSLHHGGELHDVTVGYRDLGPADGQPVVVLGGISADRELGWWPGVMGPGCALDPDRQRLLGLDFLGGIGASTGPGPGTPAPFPEIDPRDQAHALIAVLDALGLEKVTVVGASYGGMVGLALAEGSPDRVERLVVLAAAHRPHPLATAWRSIQRQILQLGRQAGCEADAVALARALAMTTFRTAEELELRFGGPVLPGPRAPVDAYLERQGAIFASRFGADALHVLLTSIDRHQIQPERVTTPTHLVGFAQDALVPPWLVRELEQRLPRCVRCTVQGSLYGHDAFLKESRAVSELLRAALEGR
jgi:homoserine O-acetyltransferase